MRTIFWRTRALFPSWGPSFWGLVAFWVTSFVPLVGFGGNGPAGRRDRAGDNDVVISEIHYHPLGDRGGEEFLELHNAGVHWIDLRGWRVAGGVRYEFPAGAALPPGGYLVVARRAEKLKAAASVPDLAIVGDFEGRLANGDDTLELLTPDGRRAAWIHYRDGSGIGSAWPRAADGFGSSLELLYPHPEWTRAWFWGASRRPGGTPGAASSLVPPTSATRARRPESPRIAEAAFGENPFVELTNPTRSTLSLDDLRLSLDSFGRGGIALSGTLSRGAVTVIDGEKIAELTIGLADGANPEAVLLVATTPEGPELRDVLRLRRHPKGGSCVRSPYDPEEVRVVAKATPGVAQRPGDAAASPVAVHEIHYHGTSDTGDEEFIELFNRSKKSVSLAGWSLQSGVDFDFPDDAELPAGGFAVVARSPDKLALRLSGAARKFLFGPFKGKLSNNGEAIVLVDSWGNVADRVLYDDDLPWPSAADGGGFSMEVVHPELPNDFAAAWSTGPAGGGPGRANPRAVKSFGPAIVDVWHEPLAPAPGESITIHAKVIGTRRVSSVAVVYRDLRSNARSKKKSLTDRGRDADGEPGDGHFAASLGKIRPGIVLGFVVLAKDRSGRVAAFPSTEREAYLMVDAAKRAERRWPEPVYSVIAPPSAWTAREEARRKNKDELPCTFSASFEGSELLGFRLPFERPRGHAEYRATIRFRGNNSFRPDRNPLDPPDGRMSYRVRLEGGGRFDGRNRFVLNAYSSYRQKAAWDVFREVGLIGSAAAFVTFRTPTFRDRQYVDVEVVNNDFLDDKLGGSSGDLFRGVRGNPFGADFTYHGTDVDQYLRVYRRENKKGDRDLTSLLGLLRALDSKDDGAYAENVAKLADVAAWGRYFAANNVLGNVEGGLSFDAPDDFYLAQRPDDGRYLIIPWDNDSTFVEHDQKLFRPRLPAIRRFLAHPAFASHYHKAVRETLDGPLSATRMRRWLSFYDDILDARQKTSLSDFAGRRRRHIRDLLRPSCPLGIPTDEGPTGGTNVVGGGTRVFVLGEVGTVGLRGALDPAVAFAARLGSHRVRFDGVTGLWTCQFDAAALRPGPNPVWLEVLGANGQLARLESVNLERVSRPTRVSTTIVGKDRWEAANNPYLIVAPLRVPSGSSLTIGAGVDVVCAAGVSITIGGMLTIEGTARRPVAFRPLDAQSTWRGIRFDTTGSGSSSRVHTLRHTRFEFGDGIGSGDEASSLGNFVHAQGSRIRLESCVFRGVRGAAVGGNGGEVELVDVIVREGDTGLRLHTGKGSVVRCRFEHLSRVGIDVEGAREVRLSSTTIARAEEVGVRARRAELELDNLLIRGCGVALECATSTVEGDHLSVSSNGLAISLDSERDGAPTSGRSRVRITRSLFWPNEALLESANGSRVVIEESLVVGRPDEDLPRGVEGATTIPEFRAPLEGDYRLTEDSPGARAADDGSDLGCSLSPP